MSVIRLLAVSILALLALPLAGLAQAPPPIMSTEASMLPLTYEDDTTFEFGIYNSKGERFATAYYRILREETEGRSAYRIKYVGRNERMSESAECWLASDTLLPMRSTRKVISGSATTYYDVAYDLGKQRIIYRKKHGDNGKVEEQQFPAQSKFYDYESLIWLIPQIEFGEAKQQQIGVFDTLNVLPMTLIVTHDGPAELAAGGKAYPAELYSFSIGATPYKLYAVNQDGRMVPARIDMAKISFVNLNLDPKKVKDGVVKTVAAKDQPKPVAKAKPEEETPAENPAGDNPLGPPPPGRKF